MRKGHAISEVARLDGVELEKLGTVSEKASPAGVVADQAVAVWLERLLDAVARYDTGAVAGAVKWLRSVTGARGFVLDVAVPLFREVGRLVGASAMDVAQEHALSAILRDQLGDLLHTLQALSPAAGEARKIVFACPEDDLHEFGILLGAVLAAARGLDVVYAGPNLPATGLARLVRNTGARTVVFGNAPIPPSERRRSFASFLSEVDDAIPADRRIFVGGEGDRPVRVLASGRPFRYLDSLLDLDHVCATIALESGEPGETP